MNMMDRLGDATKAYEAAWYSLTTLPRDKPMVARLDGRAFHTLTRKMARPFDSGLTRCMLETSKVLINQFGALGAYTQSDEITLWWQVRHDQEELPFGGRQQKLVSLLAASASVAFTQQME
jgi:tRNA(His) 5'-end guanylyltransferase